MNRFRLRTVLTALAAGLLACQVGFATTYYVDPVNGNDAWNGLQATPGTAPAGPKKTVDGSSGVKILVNAGDTVYLRANGLATGHYLNTTRADRACVFDDNFSGTSTAGQRVTVETYPSDFAAGKIATFDPGFAEFKSTTNNQWVHAQTGGSGIPADPSAHPDEYVSKLTYTATGNSGAWGCFLNADGTAGTRLLTYSRKENFREATNESSPMVLLSDPRPAGGHLVDDPNTTSINESLYKRPWAYRGPGMWWNPTTTRIHFRASATHINQPGVTDYTGPTNPNNLALSIALGPHFGFYSYTADHVTFKNILVQNGGESSGRSVGLSGNRSDNVTFDHCLFYTSRNGWSTNYTRNLKFLHCVFDGKLALYTCREDVKAEYRFISDITSLEEIDGTCRQTQTCFLQAHDLSEDMEVANCEFRNGHDGVQMWGYRPRLHHCLLENLNDEAVMFYGGHFNDDTRIYNNVIRKVMQAFSSSEGDSQNDNQAARYVYRNIVDMRVRIMGDREFSPDPVNIWRAGEDFKYNMPVPPIYAYQNTFVMPDIPGGECADFWGNVTNGQWPTPNNREFKNNIYMAIGADAPLHKIPDPAWTFMKSDGNMWWRRINNPLQPMFLSTNPANKYFNWTTMHAAFPLWEAASQNLMAYPQFASVGDYVPSDGSKLLNADYRLKSTSPGRNTGAGTGGVNLTGTGWPDSVAADSTPDCGAIPYNAAAFTVGVDSRFVFPDTTTPIVEAGDFSTTADTSNDGFESIALSATASDPNGSISSYSWKVGNTTILSAVSGSFSLPVGTHSVTCTVTDNSGTTATDVREVTITGYDNIVQNPGFEGTTPIWSLGSGCTIVTSQFRMGAKALQLATSTTVERIATQNVPITPGATVHISGWAKTQSLPTSPIKYARLKLSWLNSGGGVISSATVGTVNASAWTLRAASYTAPSNAVTVQVQAAVDAATGGTAWFDDIRVGVANLLKNLTLRAA